MLIMTQLLNYITTYRCLNFMFGRPSGKKRHNCRAGKTGQSLDRNNIGPGTWEISVSGQSEFRQKRKVYAVVRAHPFFIILNNYRITFNIPPTARDDVSIMPVDFIKSFKPSSLNSTTTWQYMEKTWSGQRCLRPSVWPSSGIMPAFRERHPLRSNPIIIAVTDSSGRPSTPFITEL